MKTTISVPWSYRLSDALRECAQSASWQQEQIKMYGHQKIRFIGGSWNNTTREVAPSTNQVGTGSEIEGEYPAPLAVGDAVAAREDCACAGGYFHKAQLFTVLKSGAGQIQIKDNTKNLNWYDAKRFTLVSRATNDLYVRTKVTLADSLRRYEEECFVLSTMGTAEARNALALCTPVMPTNRETKALPCPKSSLIQALAYCESSGTLDITLGEKNEDAATYRYENVGMSTLMGLLTSKSPGSYYTANIRKKFACVKLA